MDDNCEQQVLSVALCQRQQRDDIRAQFTTAGV